MHGLLLEWLDFSCETSQRNDKWERTYKFYFKKNASLIWTFVKI